MLTDAGVHEPPLVGPYPYYATAGTFGPDQVGFPGNGSSYVDPVFDSTIVRLTNELGQQSNADIYGKNGFFNATGTVMHHRGPGAAAIHHLIQPTTGGVVRTPVVFTADSSFSPVDPDVWYHWTNGSAILTQYSVATGLGTVLKTFGSTLGTLGGSVDWIDRSGRYMVLHLGTSYRVWDKQTDTLYTGSIPDSTYGDSWVGLSPDGNYVITSEDSSPTLGYDTKHSFAITHSTQTVSTTPVLFWTLSGDHGDVMTASDGTTYFVTYDNWDTGGVYRIDVTLAQTHADRAKQRTDNMLLFPTSIANDDIHVGCAARGTYQDWAFVSIESADDDFGDSLAGWRAYMQEIVMANVLTGEVRRLAHHRSRSTDLDYYYQPKVSASWDGGRVVWQSNFGYQATGYADLYALNVSDTTAPLGGFGGVPAPWWALRAANRWGW